MKQRIGVSGLRGRRVSIESGEARGWWLVGQVVILAIVAWQAYLAFGGPFEKSLDWTIDDSFYYLKVADSVARGAGSTFDGRHETNGYHPLWMVALLPIVSAFPDDPVTATRAAQALQVVILWGTLFLLFACARRLLPPPAPILALLLFAWPRILTQTNSLLESGLYFLLLFALLRRLLDGFPGSRESSPRRDLVTGFVAALVFLCRLDSVFLIGALGLSLLVVDPRRAFRPGVFTFLAPVAVLGGAYLLWNMTRFGHLTPVSGALKTTFPDIGPHWEYLWRFGDFALFAALGGAWWIRDVYRGWTAPTRGTPPSAIAVFGLAAAFHFVYTLLFMKWGVENWHFCLSVPAGILLVTWGAARGVAIFVDGSAKGGAPARTAARRSAGAWAAILAITAAAITVSLAVSRARHKDLLLPHYYRAARWAHEKTPREALFAMTDAGIFSWFSGRATINTDGLVNDFAYVETLRRGAFAEYIASEKVDYVMDYWNWGDEALLRGGYGTKTIRARLRPHGADGGAITVREEDEVYREVFRARSPVTKAVEEDALLIWRLPR